ncbi:MAG: hypothetical protein ABJF23_15740 [Bryobacteraceae bacterium]
MRLNDFFKGSDTSLGVFYPMHYLVAVFRNLELARDAARKLSQAGYHEGDVTVADGPEVIALAKDETGLGAFLMQALSRFISAEQTYTDHDLEHAQHGAGFLVAHCPTDAIKTEVWGIVESEGPLDARYYGHGGIVHLAGDSFPI